MQPRLSNVRAGSESNVRTHPSQVVVHILLHLQLRLLGLKVFLHLSYLSRVVSRVPPHVAEMGILTAQPI
jgi:hypothetical protein